MKKIEQKNIYIKNRHIILNRAKEYYTSNKEQKVKKYQKKYRKNMSNEQKQKMKEYQKEYRKNMSDEQKQKYKENKRNKKLNNEKIIITIIIDNNHFNDVIKL